MTQLGGLLSQARHITWPGPGGAGKTMHQAIEAGARAVGAAFADGVWLPDRAAIADPGRVPLVVMEVLGVRQGADLPALEAAAPGCAQPTCCWSWITVCIYQMPARGQATVALLRGHRGCRYWPPAVEPLDLPGEVVFKAVSLPVPSAEDATSRPWAKPPQSACSA